VNSIHYLLKPITMEALERALQKREDHHQSRNTPLLRQLAEQLQNPRKFKETFLVNHRDRLLPISIDKIAYFLIKEQAVFLFEKSGKNYKTDQKLEELEQELDPRWFFRANRQCIVHKDAIHSLQHYFNGKLILNTDPPCPQRLVISKSKAPLIKSWLTQS